MLQGTYRELGTIQARIHKDDPNFATGKYFGAGMVFGGYRASQRQFLRNQGRGNITLSADGNSISSVFDRRGTGARDEFSSFILLDGVRVSSTLTDRVAQCGIIDYTATDYIMGSYTAVISENVTTSLEACYTAGMSVSSYQDMSMNGSVILAGINYGKCAFNGQICGSDWFEYSAGRFGVTIHKKLMDGRVYESYWRGPTPQSVNLTAMPEAHGNIWWTAVAATGATCEQNEDEFYNPLKCSVMSNEFCEWQAGYGLCWVNSAKVHNSTGTSCYKTPFVSVV
jgi:hypothetical protein